MSARRCNSERFASRALRIIAVLVSVGLVCVSPVKAAPWVQETVPLDDTMPTDLAFNPASGAAWACGSNAVYMRVGPNHWEQEYIVGYGGGDSSIAFAGPDAYGIASTKYQGNLEYSQGGTTEMILQGRFASTSLAFKSDGNPAVAYARLDREGAGRHGVEYIEFVGSAWSVPLEIPGWVSGLTSLALDANDRPWIGFTEPHGTVGVEIPEFRVAHYNGIDWDVWTVQPDATNGSEQSLSLDPNGVPVVAWLGYSAGYTGEGRLSRFDGSQWVTDAQPFALNARDAAALAFDPVTGRAVVAYVGLDYNLWLAREGEDGWTQERLRSDGLARPYISLAFDGDGHIAILEGNSYWIPEPGTSLLLAVGGLSAARRRRR